MENIPQLLLQIYLLTQSGSDSISSNQIVYISMGFSILSIIISLLAMISQRDIVRSRDYVSIEYDVKGPMVVDKLKQCRNRRNKLQLQISSLIGVERNLVEIVKPDQIKQGLRVCVNFHVNNTRAIDLSMENEMKSAQLSGELGNIMKEVWELSDVPKIENIKYVKHDSKIRREQTAVIKMNLVNDDKNNDDNGQSGIIKK